MVKRVPGQAAQLNKRASSRAAPKAEPEEYSDDVDGNLAFSSSRVEDSDEEDDDAVFNLKGGDSSDDDDDEDDSEDDEEVSIVF